MMIAKWKIGADVVGLDLGVSRVWLGGGEPGGGGKERKDGGK